MGFPLGLPVIATAPVRRVRPLGDGATPNVGVGQMVSAGQTVATRAGRLGKADAVLAGLDGQVVEVVPGQGLTIAGTAMVITGVLGLGATAVGPLVIVAEAQPPETIQIPSGAVLVVAGVLSPELLKRAIAEGAAAVVAGSMALADLESVARADLTAILDGLIPGETALPLPLVLTQGLGAWPVDADRSARLADRAGAIALVDGATKPRRGMRPEILLSQPQASAVTNLPALPALPADDTPVPGARVRVVAGPRQSASGEVLHIFARPQRVMSGLLLRCAQVRLADGATAAIPLAFLERIG